MPYEKPEYPSLIIETDKLGLQQCVDEVIEPQKRAHSPQIAAGSFNFC